MRLIRYIIKLFRINPPIVEHISVEDEKLDREIKAMREGTKKFSEIVGENPMDEIDYIISNGFEVHCKLYRECTTVKPVSYTSSNPRLIGFTQSDCGNHVYSSGGR